MSHEEYLEWARIELGETRQVFARDTRKPADAPLVLMPENEADRFWEDARNGYLICPVSGCVSPRLITRHYEDRRDHFAHACGAGVTHRELPATVVGHMLRRWAARLDERNEVFGRQNVEGVPVTGLVRLAGGEQVALCYVDGLLGVQSWRAQQAALESAGVAGVWIFPPHNKRYFEAPEADPAPAEDVGGLVCDKRLFKAMRGGGSWPLFVNAERARLANLIVPRKKIAARLGLQPPPFVENVLHLVSSPLEGCGLCKDGIVTGAVTALDLEKIRSGYRSRPAPWPAAGGYGRMWPSGRSRRVGPSGRYRPRQGRAFERSR